MRDLKPVVVLTDEPAPVHDLARLFVRLILAQHAPEPPPDAGVHAAPGPRPRARG